MNSKNIIFIVKFIFLSRTIKYYFAKENDVMVNNQRTILTKVLFYQKNAFINIKNYKSIFRTLVLKSNLIIKISYLCTKFQ